MAEFVQEYGALRWGAVAAFLIAGGIVVGRLAAGGKWFRCVDQESDAAHLMMCLVMLAMLVFPAAADPRAVSGVLTAMSVVYAGLLLARVLEWRSGSRGRVVGALMPGESVMAFGYHVVAALAMVYAMSGHSMTGPMAHGSMSAGGVSEHAGPAVWPMLVLAGLFVVDAVVMAVPGARRALRHVFPHPVGVGSIAVVPHLVMDLGTAFMLVAAAAG
ncbi:DUF5134 domain-containing protein [Nocardia sp. NPDC051030]|uniref:DUF5134 domain-containing protein n=1 Tax=Nocardia sp. NPDC051030 TaxID=3155162 RepID=UPI0034286FCD